MRDGRRVIALLALAPLVLLFVACTGGSGNAGLDCTKARTAVTRFVTEDLDMAATSDAIAVISNLRKKAEDDKSPTGKQADEAADRLDKLVKATEKPCQDAEKQNLAGAAVSTTSTTVIPPAALDKVEAITFTPEAKQALTNTLGLTSTGDPKRFAFGDPSRPDEVTINKVNWDLFVTDRDPSLSFSREPLKSAEAVKAFNAETGERAVAARKALQAAIDNDKVVQAAAAKEGVPFKTVDDCRFIPVQFLKQVDYEGLAYFFTDANGGRLQSDPGFRRAPAGDVAWLCAISTNRNDPNAPYNIVENGGERAACGNPLSKPVSPATARPETDTKPVTGPTTTVATTAPERGVSATSTSATTPTTAGQTTTTAHVTTTRVTTTTTRVVTTTSRATTTTAAPTTTSRPTTTTTRGCPPGQVPNTSVPGQCLETKPGNGVSGNGSAVGNTSPGAGVVGQTPDTIRQTGSAAETPTITTARATTTAAPSTTRATTTTTRASTTAPPTTPATTGTTSGPTTTIQAANQPSVVTAGTTPLCDRAHPNGVTCD